MTSEATVPTDGGAPTAAPPGVESAPESPLLKAAQKRYSNLAELLARGTEGLRDDEVVHDLRVGSRRLGEVARLLGKFMDKPASKAVEASLKALRRAMGDLRDSDVTREHLERWHMPHAVRLVAHEVALALAADRERLVEAAAGQMNSTSLQGAMLVLARVLEDRGRPESAAASESDLRRAVQGGLRKRKKQLRKAMGEAARKQTAESLHAARIAVKKLRYNAELAAETGLERGWKKQVVFLKRLQELLGTHHDVHVIVGLLEAHLRDPRPKPIARLAPVWRKWRREKEQEQTRRAVDFYLKSHVWVNEKG